MLGFFPEPREARGEGYVEEEQVGWPGGSGQDLQTKQRGQVSLWVQREATKDLKQERDTVRIHFTKPILLLVRKAARGLIRRPLRGWGMAVARPAEGRSRSSALLRKLILVSGGDANNGCIRCEFMESSRQRLPARLQPHLGFF